MSYEEHIGENIKNVRKDQSLSQQQLADRCGMSNTMISEYERGNKIPNLVTTAKIASALKVSIDRLYYGDENNAFITTVDDDGRKIVNAVYLLWDKGVVWYHENLRYSVPPSMDDNNGYFLFISQFPEQIKRLIASLNDYKAKKDTFPDPEAYLEMILSSVASDINKEIEKQESEKEIKHKMFV
ncbi:MAG: helix-turn-helix transcriptional regulator [Butyrivibrio sp.]|nr:helix-turn-helix transcriptional regulator [Butyrivibrio sp.]